MQKQQSMFGEIVEISVFPVIIHVISQDFQFFNQSSMLFHRIFHETIQLFWDIRTNTGDVGVAGGIQVLEPAMLGLSMGPPGKL